MISDILPLRAAPGAVLQERATCTATTAIVALDRMDRARERKTRQHGGPGRAVSAAPVDDLAATQLAVISSR
jgi:hypothetical protein